VKFIPFGSSSHLNSIDLLRRSLRVEPSGSIGSFCEDPKLKGSIGSYYTAAELNPFVFFPRHLEMYQQPPAVISI
jgi:hypothetical protein